MDKYKLGIGDAELLDFWHVLTRFKSGSEIMNAIDETIAADFGGANLGKLVTIEDKVKICMAFIRFLADVEPQLMFGLGVTSIGPIGAIIYNHTFSSNGGPYKASDEMTGAVGFDDVIIDVPENVPTGELVITSNGYHDVTSVATVNVQVPEPSGTLSASVTLGDLIDVKDYEFISIDNIIS